MNRDAPRTPLVGDPLMAVCQRPATGLATHRNRAGRRSAGVERTVGLRVEVLPGVGRGLLACTLDLRTGVICPL